MDNEEFITNTPSKEISFDIPDTIIENKNKESNDNLLKKLAEINTANQRYPYCIVWTPISCITALIPCIGHCGICTSTGVIHDFAGEYYVCVDNMAFGWPCKYIQLKLNEQEIEQWDMAVAKGDEQFNKEVHNLIT